jgi:hypothetical protein
MTNKVDQALEGQLSVDALDDAEQEEFFEGFAALTRKPSEREKAFFAARERLGLGVGLDDDGNLVYPAVRMPPSTDGVQ